MKITRLDLMNFRRYEYSQIEFTDGLNIILGDNASGKTTILEAISMFALGRSLRTRLDKELIRFGQPEAQLRIKTQTISGGAQDMAIKISGKGKQIAINGSAKKHVSEILGHLYIIAFTPETLQLIKAGPEERRRFLDVAMAQCVRGYAEVLRSYQHILQQRNHLLRMRQTESLTIWNEQLSELGARIISERQNFSRELAAGARVLYESLTKSSEKLTVQYRTQCSGRSFAEIKQALESLLSRHLQTDAMRGYTTVGPHRDDLHVLIDDHHAAKFASQGQIRTAVLALQLSLIEYIETHNGESPVILLDDVLSELDGQRQEQVLKFLGAFQTIITATHKPTIDWNPLQSGKVIRVDRGIILSEG